MVSWVSLSWVSMSSWVSLSSWVPRVFSPWLWLSSEIMNILPFCYTYYYLKGGTISLFLQAGVYFNWVVSSLRLLGPDINQRIPDLLPFKLKKKCANNKQFFTENFSKLKLLYKSMCVLPTIRTSQEFQVAVKLCPSRTLGTASHPLGQWTVHHPRPQTLCCRLWVPLPHCSPFWTCQVGRMWPRRRAMNNMRI